MKLEYRNTDLVEYQFKIREGNKISFSYEEIKKHDAITKQLKKHLKTCANNRRKRKRKKK